jgi:hypothetical protein
MATEGGDHRMVRFLGFKVFWKHQTENIEIPTDEGHMECLIPAIEAAENGAGLLLNVLQEST